MPQRKPQRCQAGGDADAYFCYKQCIAALLLAVVDADGRFLWVTDGAPGCVSNAGLWGHDAMRLSIEDFQEAAERMWPVGEGLWAAMGLIALDNAREDMAADAEWRRRQRYHTVSDLPRSPC